MAGDLAGHPALVRRDKTISGTVICWGKAVARLDPEDLELLNLTKFELRADRRFALINVFATH
jgi:hypothetical protein